MRSIISVPVRLLAPLAVGLALAPASACGSSEAGIQGVSCSSDGDCNGGLQCLPYQASADAGVDAGCAPVDRRCLKPCRADSDCTAQGPGLFCVMACSGKAACEPR